MITLLENYRVVIYQDNDTINPFSNEWTVPTMYETYSRCNNIQDFSKGDIKEFIKSKLTAKTIEYHKNELIEILELTIPVEEECEYEITEEFNSTRTNIEQLSAICELLQIPHKKWESIGYSQGDRVKVLSVITDKFVEYTGVHLDNYNSSLNNNAELFDNWIWGNTYGFSLEQKETYTNKIGKSIEVWESIDNVGGFYGRDIEGIADYINIEGASREEVEELIKEGFKNIKY